jgi:hypothetical protein
VLKTLVITHGARTSPQRSNTMKVSELIEILSEMNPDAQVLIASQQNWPYAERRFMRSGPAAEPRSPS